MSLYRSYQLIGGNEPWTPIHSSANLDLLKPTLVTVLACDTLLAKDSTRELIDKAKYFGPMYFDLDDADDLQNSINGAKALWAKFKELGLRETDVEVFLSGKKGLHLFISPVCFMEKQLAVHKLPAIYKEIAFTLAVDTVDFAVYSSRRGRMLRTHYNQRDNGNYKVQISVSELLSLTVPSYAALCAAPRPLQPCQPHFCPKLALLSEGVRQKVSAQRRVKHKPVDPATLAKHLPTVERLMRGDNLREGLGFNKIAIQLAIYAREAKLSEDRFIADCQGLLDNHVSDGYRYNTKVKREHELRRMFTYLEDNSGYDYSIGPIRSMLQPAGGSGEEGQEEGEEQAALEENGGLSIKGSSYYIANDQGEKHIMDGVFIDTEVLQSIELDQISCLYTKLKTRDRTYRATLERSDFVSSAALHKAVSRNGVSFTGSDIHARNVYSYMLKESKISGKTVYATEREGLDLLQIPLCDIMEARQPFLVWADSRGVILPTSLIDQGLEIRFIGFPSPEGVMKTDLAETPSFDDWVLAKKSNRRTLLTTIHGLLGCQSAGTLSKMIGWTTACFFSQMFRKLYGKYPLMHLVGVAGSGKSETLAGLLHMFYYNQDPQTQSPASTNFAVTNAITGSYS